MTAYAQQVRYPDEAAAILHPAEPTAAIPAAVGEIQMMKQFSTPVGKLDQHRVTEGIAELEAAGLMPTGLTPHRWRISRRPDSSFA